MWGRYLIWLWYNPFLSPELEDSSAYKLIKLHIFSDQNTRTTFSKFNRNPHGPHVYMWKRTWQHVDRPREWGPSDFDISFKRVSKYLIGWDFSYKNNTKIINKEIVSSWFVLSGLDCETSWLSPCVLKRRVASVVNLWFLFKHKIFCRIKNKCLHNKIQVNRKSQKTNTLYFRHT